MFEIELSSERSFLHQSRYGMCVTNGTHVLFANVALAEMLGYRPEALVGVACHELVVAADIEHVRDVQRAVLHGERESGEFRARLRARGDAAVREVVGYASRVFQDGNAALLCTIHDIGREKRGESALRDYARQLRLLTQQLIEVQENERRNLARELHDEIGQQLTTVRMALEAIADNRTDGADIQEVLVNVARLTSQVREMSLDLRPSMLDDLGLAAALRWYVNRSARLAHVDAVLEIDPAFPRLRATIETLFFRVAQEAITNVARHARASTLRVSLDAEAGLVRLRVADDGCGFDPAAAHARMLQGRSAGLLGMHERAALAGARFHVESLAGKGSELSLVLPLQSAELR